MRSRFTLFVVSWRTLSIFLFYIYIGRDRYDLGGKADTVSCSVWTFSKYLVVIYVILHQNINTFVGFKRKWNMMSEFLPFLQKHWQHDFKQGLFPCAVVANDMQLTPAPKKPCGCEVILCGIKPEHTKTWLRVRENQNIGGPNDSTAQVQTSEVFMCPWGVCCEWLQRASGTPVAKWTSFAGAVELMNRRCLSWQSFNTLPSHRLIIQQHLLSTWLYVAGGNGSRKNC